MCKADDPLGFDVGLLCNLKQSLDSFVSVADTWLVVGQCFVWSLPRNVDDTKHQQVSITIARDRRCGLHDPLYVLDRIFIEYRDEQPVSTLSEFRGIFHADCTFVCAFLCVFIAA
jgi:hypothetical protein